MEKNPVPMFGCHFCNNKPTDCTFVDYVEAPDGRDELWPMWKCNDCKELLI